MNPKRHLGRFRPRAPSDLHEWRMERGVQHPRPRPNEWKAKKWRARSGFWLNLIKAEFERLAQQTEAWEYAEPILKAPVNHRFVPGFPVAISEPGGVGISVRHAVDLLGAPGWRDEQRKRNLAARDASWWWRQKLARKSRRSHPPKPCPNRRARRLKLQAAK